MGSVLWAGRDSTPSHHSSLPDEGSRFSQSNCSSFCMQHSVMNDTVCFRCRVAMETIQELCDTLNFSDYSSAIIHGLARVIDNCSELRPVAMDTLCCLVVQLGHKYTVFIPMMTKVGGCVSCQ